MRYRMDQLIFVYNADSGKLQALAHTLHKIISPSTYSCRLCQLSHSWFFEKAVWKDFVEKLDAECLFYHRDEFLALYPSVSFQYPLVLLKNEDGLMELLSAADFSGLKEISALSELLENKLSTVKDENFSYYSGL